MEDPQHRGQANSESPHELELSAQKSQLQQEIIALHRTGTIHQDNSLLYIKKLAYNEVVDTLHSFHQGARVDPMDKLPANIWDNILRRMSASSFNDSWYDAPQTQYIFPLIMVSKRWRYFVLSEPSHWTTISLKKCKYEIDERVTWQLNLSGSLPLTIVISPSFDRWTRVRSDLIKHRERIETIVIGDFCSRPGYHSSKNPRSPSPVREILRDLASAPNLVTMDRMCHLDGRWTDMDAFVTGCGSLRRLPNVLLTSQMLRTMKGRLDLQEVMTCDNILAVSPILETVSNVNKVSFIYFYRPEDLPMIESNHQFNGQLPWKKLVYHLYSHPFPVSFLRQLPMLTSLELSVDWDTLKEITLMLHDLPNLEFLKLIATVNEGDSLISPQMISPNLHIRHLDAFIDYPESYRYLYNVGDVVIEMILCAVPMAENITFSTTNVPHAFRFLALDGCRQSKELRLFCCKEVGHVSSPVELPSQVEDVLLSCLPRDIPLIRSTSVRSLRCTFFPEYTDTGFRPALTAANWPRVETATLLTHVFDWKQSSLLSLKAITLWERTNGKSIDHTLTSFLCELALRPESYPLLEEITLFGCPEWDILAIMLEHRNLLADSSIRRIKKVTIHAACPLSICQDISDLIKGKWLQRPKKELSLAGNARNISDLNTPGCLMCHRMLRVCNEPIKRDWKLTKLFKDNAVLLRLQEYPDNDEEILNTWETRIKLWDDLKGFPKRRKPRCNDSAEYLDRQKTIDANY